MILNSYCKKWEILHYNSNGECIYGGIRMIWIYIMLPVVVLSGIAIYFDKKAGMAPTDDMRTADKLEEYPPEHGMNSFGP